MGTRSSRNNGSALEGTGASEAAVPYDWVGLPRRPEVPLCFAIMPITTPADQLGNYGNDSEHFRRVARYIFKPAAEAAGFTFKEPASTTSEIIQAEIIKFLEEADLVLCDTSLWNANVFFELGIRVALDRPVAMVKDDLTERIPFDNAMINCHTYCSRLDVWKVEEEVPKLRDFLATAGSQNQNALWKYFGITQRAEQTNYENPEDAKLELLLGEVTLLRRAIVGQGSTTAAIPGLRTGGDLPSRLGRPQVSGVDDAVIRNLLKRHLGLVKEGAFTLSGGRLDVVCERSLSDGKVGRLVEDAFRLMGDLLEIQFHEGKSVRRHLRPDYR